jgi:hypothetical protein
MTRKIKRDLKDIYMIRIIDDNLKQKLKFVLKHPIEEKGKRKYKKEKPEKAKKNTDIQETKSNQKKVK